MCEGEEESVCVCEEEEEHMRGRLIGKACVGVCVRESVCGCM